MYHRIAKESFDPWGMVVSPELFTEQINWLAHGRTVLTLANFSLAHKEGKLPADALAITFDDGYAQTATLAARVLADAKLPATMFLSPGSLQRGGEYWWDELEQLVLGSAAARLRLDGQEILLGQQFNSDIRWRPYARPRTPRQRAHRSLWSILHPKSADGVRAAMVELRCDAGITPQPRESHRMLRAGELTSIISPNIEFGSHGLTHISLSSVEVPEQIREIVEGKEQLERLTGDPVLSLSYPFGDWSTELERMVEQAGFSCGCITDDRSVPPDAPLFALPRLPVFDWTARELERRLSRG